MLFFLGWILLCMACGWVASNYERDFWSYFFLAFFLSPLVGFIVVLSKGKTGKKCSQCAELVKQDAKVCRYCGYSFAGTAIEKHSQIKVDTETNIAERVSFEEFVTLQDKFKKGEITEAEMDRKKKIYYGSN